MRVPFQKAVSIRSDTEAEYGGKIKNSILDFLCCGVRFVAMSHLWIKSYWRTVYRLNTGC